jgi:hypothetical protein
VFLLFGSSIAFWISIAGFAPPSGEIYTTQSAILGTPGWPTSTPEPDTEIVEVVPSVDEIQVGETISVTVSVIPREDCYYYLYQITLNQSNPLFSYIAPPTALVGPPVENPLTYELQALAAGELVFNAVVYGEQWCPPTGGLLWLYLYGSSDPVRVLGSGDLLYQSYLPIIQVTIDQLGILEQD